MSQALRREASDAARKGRHLIRAKGRLDPVARFRGLALLRRATRARRLAVLLGRRARPGAARAVARPPASKRAATSALAEFVSAHLRDSTYLQRAVSLALKGRYAAAVRRRLERLLRDHQGRQLKLRVLAAALKAGKRAYVPPGFLPKSVSVGLPPMKPGSLRLSPRR